MHRFIPRLALKGLALTGILGLAGLVPAGPGYAQDFAPDPAETPRPLPEDGPREPERPRRTVLEVEIVRVESDGTVGTPFRLLAVAEDGPVEGRKLHAVERDDLPFPIYWTASLLDRRHHVAEIHFFRDAGSEAPLPHQIAFLDGDAETQVELDRGFTWALRWIEARDEEEHLVDGERTYRPVPNRPETPRP